MASVHRRRDPKTGRPTGNWIAVWKDAAGKTRTKTCGREERAARRVADQKESEAILLREGVVKPGVKIQEEAALQPIADHVEAYRLELISRENTAKHVRHTIGVIAALLADAKVDSIGLMPPERIQSALGRVRATRSARTANFARVAFRGWVNWLWENGRIAEIPPGLRKLAKYNEKVNRVHPRRVLTAEEFDRVIASAESGPDFYFYGPTKSKHQRVPVPGHERAALYRLAAITGLRANEIRTLSPNRFSLDGPEPTVKIWAGYSKNRKEYDQPVRLSDAAWLKGWLEGRGGAPPRVGDKPVSHLRRDMERAGIEYRTDEGFADFHALRAFYVVQLWIAGVDIKLIQILARHSSITLTMDTYCKAGGKDVRAALDAIDGNKPGGEG